MHESNIQNKTAIILGATGLTGSLLLKKLIEDNRYIKIKIFTRQALDIPHPKTEAIICDLLELDKYRDHFFGNEVYCCIGTTAKQTPDKSLYKQIDFGIPVQVAKLCKENDIPTLLVISSIGANSRSSIFYSRTKGEMEKAVLAENIKNTYILRPSVITGKRKETRIGEKIGIIFTRLITPLLIGPLKKYRPINADTIAVAMIRIAHKGYETSIISSDAIQKLGSR